MLRRLIAPVLTFLLLASCSSENRIAGYVYMRLNANPTTLDPALIVDVTGGTIAAKIFNGLVRLGPGLKVAPDLAQSWSVSADGLRYRFVLRSGVRFHSGRELRAEDVRYSLQRVLSPATRASQTWVLDRIDGADDFMAGRAKSLRGIRVIDDRTVEITLSGPYSPFLYLLTMPTAYIVPAEDVRRWGDDFSAHAAGTGPFMLESWQPSRAVVLRRNDAYFEGAPAVKGLVYRVIPEELTAVAEFELGNLDVLQIPPSEFMCYIRSAKWKGLISSQETISTNYLGMDCSRPPFDDPELRRAVSMAIDRARILRTIEEGRGQLADGPVPAALRRWPPPKPYAFDMARAREIIKARHAGGTVVNFYITADQQVVDMAEVMQSYLKDAGLDVRIVQLEWSGFKAAVNEGKADMFSLSWFADYPDPENFLAPLFLSTNFGAGGNRTRYSNPEVDGLIRQGEAATTEAERDRSYAQAEEIIVHDAPWVFLWHRTDYFVRQPRVKRFNLYPVYSMDKGMEVGL